MAVGFSLWNTLRPMATPAAPASTASRILARVAASDALEPPRITTGAKVEEVTREKSWQ